VQEHKIIADIVKRIHEASTELFSARLKIPRVFVVNINEANALVLPGGEVFVFTGIFNVAQDNSELASVIGHEVSKSFDYRWLIIS
jgi:predicted Zn-dependent protease